MGCQDGGATVTKSACSSPGTSYPPHPVPTQPDEVPTRAACKALDIYLHGLFRVYNTLGTQGWGPCQSLCRQSRLREGRPHAQGNTASQQLFPCHLPHPTTPDAFVKAPPPTHGHALLPQPGRLDTQGAPRTGCPKDSTPRSALWLEASRVRGRCRPGKQLPLHSAELEQTS